MKKQLSIIQTLNFDPGTLDPIHSSVRFLSPEFHWMSWALSFLQLQKLYGEVILYTNKYGKEILIDRLGLPYSEVHVIFDEIHIPKGFDVLPKVYTYNMQEKPFLHFDGDVFMWEKLPEKLLEQPLIVQNVEKADQFYRSIYNILEERKIWLHDTILEELSSEELLRVYNLGIVGGNDITFFQYFTKESLEMINKNQKNLSALADGYLNLIYEQHLFYCLSKKLKQTVGCYLNKEIENLDFSHFANFSEVPYSNNFVHLVGPFKRDEETCLQLARRLRNDYPEYFYKIIKECQKANVSMYLKYYNTDYKSDNNVSNLINWQKEYESEKYQFSKLDNIFGNPEILFNTSFMIKEQIGQLKSLNFESCSTLNGFLKKLSDLKVDELDRLIIFFLRKPLKFKTLIKKLKPYFDEKEVENQHKAFLQLISLKIRSGCEKNLYRVIS